MDYQKHYDALILRAHNRVAPEVTESHHIIPRCMGGSDGKSNRANLTPEEHFVAHQLLIKIYPDQLGLVVAATLMARDNRNGKRSNNKLYGWLRKRASEVASVARTGKPLAESTRRRISEVLKASPAMRADAESRRGIPRPDDVKAKISESHKASPKANAALKAMHARKVGVPRAAETKAKISALHKGRKLTDEHKESISAALAGKVKSEITRAKLSAALTGRPGTMRGRSHSEETKRKMSIAGMGRKMSEETIKKMVASKTPEQRRQGALKAWETKRAKATAS